jgi:hypothetical protein
MVTSKIVLIYKIKFSFGLILYFILQVHLLAFTLWVGLLQWIIYRPAFGASLRRHHLLSHPKSKSCTGYFLALWIPRSFQHAGWALWILPEGKLGDLPIIGMCVSSNTFLEAEVPGAPRVLCLWRLVKREVGWWCHRAWSRPCPSCGS